MEVLEAGEQPEIIEAHECLVEPFPLQINNFFLIKDSIPREYTG